MHRLTAIAALTTIALSVAACGGNTNSADRFCDSTAGLQDQLLAAQAPDSESVIDTLAEADPPDEIADAYANLIDAYEDMGADQDTLTDPATATRLADLNDDITTIDTYLRTECTPN
jgi:hypothetical protein